MRLGLGSSFGAGAEVCIGGLRSWGSRLAKLRSGTHWDSSLPTAVSPIHTSASAQSMSATARTLAKSEPLRTGSVVSGRVTVTSILTP